MTYDLALDKPDRDRALAEGGSRAIAEGRPYVVLVDTDGNWKYTPLAEMNHLDIEDALRQPAARYCSPSGKILEISSEEDLNDEGK